MQQPLAQWNKNRDVWETGEADLFSEHLDVFSETFPKSGMTRNGVLFPRPEWAPLTAVKGSSSSLSLLPTPTAERPDARKSEAFGGGRATFYDIIQNQKFGQYAPAVERWGFAMGRQAPPPTDITVGGKHHLSSRFVEWMMGLSDGWVTSPNIGLPRTRQLKALGNGVVPQQAKAALIHLLGRRDGEETDNDGHEK